MAKKYPWRRCRCRRDAVSSDALYKSKETTTGLSGLRITCRMSEVGGGKKLAPDQELQCENLRRRATDTFDLQKFG